MALRTAHGRAAELGSGPRVEVLPADELPDPVPSQMPAGASIVHGPDHRFAPGNTAASLGGLAKRGKVSLVASLGLADIDKLEAFRPYARKAASFRRAHCGELSALAGGVCGSGPSSMVASAALQLAFSRFLFDRGAVAGNIDDIKTASKLADSSRQNILAAYELAVREGQRRRQGEKLDPIAAFEAKQRAMRREGELVVEAE